MGRVANHLGLPWRFLVVVPARSYEAPFQSADCHCWMIILWSICRVCILSHGNGEILKGLGEWNMGARMEAAGIIQVRDKWME